MKLAGESRPVWWMNPFGNRLLVGVVLIELVLLLGFLTPSRADVLGGGWPSGWGWLIAASAIPVVLLADAAGKTRRRP